MHLEESKDFLLVGGKNLVPLLLEHSFDGLQLRGVIGSHLDKLSLHGGDQVVDVLVHLGDGLDVVLVLGLKSILELVDQLLLVLDDFLASVLLSVDILNKI